MQALSIAMSTAMPTGAPDRWNLLQRARVSYYRGRSGDFLVMLKRNVTPITDTSRYISTHGSPWDYDRRVPIIFWRDGYVGQPDEAVVDTVDIMPTLASLIGLSLAPGATDGICRAVSPGATCLNR